MRIASAKAVITGALCALPFLAANAVVAGRIEPFFSLIRPGIHTSGREYVLLAVVLLLLPLGAWIAIRPALKTGPDGRRPFYLVNALVAVIMVMGFVAITIGLGTDIYRCDVLGIPNCD